MLTSTRPTYLFGHGPDEKSISNKSVVGETQINANYFICFIKDVEVNSNIFFFLSDFEIIHFLNRLDIIHLKLILKYILDDRIESDVVD